jgi:shikimate 5-dehydrogenase
MFLYQGTEQFSLWTGKEPPVELMREVVLARLQTG